MLLILVVLVSAASGTYVGASFFPQQAPNVTVTTTIYTTTTSWTTSTIWSTMTEVVQGVLTTVEYTTSTSTVTVTGSTSYRTAKIVTANGNARIGTAQSKFGGASGLFGGAAYLSLADSADWAFGSGDFTIDFWVRFNALPGYNGWSMFYSQGANGDDRNVFYLGLMNQAGTYRWGLQIYSSIQLRWTTSPTVSTNTWYHVALVRNGNNWICFQDGTSLGTQTNSNSVPDFAALLYIGVYSNGQNSCFLNGWLDEFRVSKGVARWTSNFTPPASAHTGDSNTLLLLHMDGADGSTTFSDGY
jgi:hypothetical protein